MLQRLPLPDADIRLDQAWLAPSEADHLFEVLHAQVAWENHPVRLFGREHPAPRLSCWIGDPDACYRYSGVVREPRPWLDALGSLRDRLNSELGLDLNSVLANLYRDGADGMGWHCDDERELGPRPVIASISLGAMRRFMLKHRSGAPRSAIDLEPGSLLLMQGDTQSFWRHSLPRTARAVGPRINLTFRRIASAQLDPMRAALSKGPPSCR